MSYDKMIYFISILFVVLTAFVPEQTLAGTYRTCIQDFYPKGFSVDHHVQGYSVDIIKALHIVDRTIDFVGSDKICSFPKIETDLVAGNLDIFVSAFKTPEREKKFHFIDVPIHIFRFLLVVRRDDPVKIKTLNEIHTIPNNVILTLRTTGLQAFLEGYPGLKLEASSDTVDANLTKLEKGRGRFFLVSDLGLKNILNRPKWKGKFKILPAVFGTEAQYAMASKKLSIKDLELLKHALYSLRSMGKLDKIFQAY